MTNTYPIRKDTIGRRSRFNRQPTGKRIQLTKRDLDILRLLWRYRYLRSDRIVDYLTPKSKKRLIERLGDLFHETTLISRPRAQWAEFQAEHKPIAYELTQNGLGTLYETQSGLTLPYPIVSFGGEVERAIVQFHHALQISELLFDIEQSLINEKGRKTDGDQKSEINATRPTIISQGEFLEQMSNSIDKPFSKIEFAVTIPKSRFLPFQKTPHPTKIIPDAFFAILHQVQKQSLYRFYALEVERKNPLKRRSLEKPSSLKKLLAYQALLQSDGAQKQLTIPNLFLVIAAETEAKLLTIVEMAMQIWSKNEQMFLLFAPPPPYRSWQMWINDNSHRHSKEQVSLFMEIAQKWCKHFEP